MIRQVGAARSSSRATAARIASGSPASASTTSTPGLPFATSAWRWDTATGSLSTYATRACGATAWAVSWVLGAVGRPQPRSMNWPTPWFATQVTARDRNCRFSGTMSAAGGKTATSRSPISRSAAKLSLPPSR